MARGTWLKQWRINAGLSQQAAANRFRISRSRYSEIENGAVAWARTSLTIARVTGISVEDFHRRSPWLQGHPKKPHR
jgi:transcriptional regulator with XRE-family HTH domain